jgi:hypothetical protein
MIYLPYERILVDETAVEEIAHVRLRGMKRVMQLWHKAMIEGK